MTRFTIFPVCGLLVALVAFNVQSAQVDTKPADEKSGSQDQPDDQMRLSRFRGIPGYGLLRLNYVHDKLGLTDEQKSKLRSIGDQYYEDMRKDWANIYNMTREKRDAAIAAVRTKAAAAMEDIKKRVEKVLSPAQIEQLEAMRLKIHGPNALEDVRNVDLLKVTAKQRAAIQKLREEMRMHYRQTRDDLWGKILEVLTPEQRAKLKELVKPGLGDRLHRHGVESEVKSDEPAPAIERSGNTED